MKYLSCLMIVFYFLPALADLRVDLFQQVHQFYQIEENEKTATVHWGVSNQSHLKTVVPISVTKALKGQLIAELSHFSPQSVTGCRNLLRITIKNSRYLCIEHSSPEMTHFISRLMSQLLHMSGRYHLSAKPKR